VSAEHGLRQTAWWLVAGLLVASATLAAERRAQSLDLSTRAIVARAAAYVGGYQREFAFLIADEQTVQEALLGKDDLRVPVGARTTRGEVFITYLENLRHWSVARDIAEVDGRPVLNRPDLRALLNREDPDAVARRLFAINARYNIGGVVRNFSDPMIALLPVGDAHRPRFGFDVASIERRPEGALATLAFRERERPTLVRPQSGGAAYARGTLTVDAATGTIRRTHFTVRYEHVVAELTTEFSYDDRLGLWVPATLTERYTARADGLEDLVTAVSTYTNYRRFEASGRIVGSGVRQ
jgi:hypothetical protein